MTISCTTWDAMEDADLLNNSVYTTKNCFGAGVPMFRHNSPTIGIMREI
eukprot:COSAG06_NODE_7116_length_2626_cov_1.737238_2_plen_49_part_00